MTIPSRDSDLGEFQDGSDRERAPDLAELFGEIFAEKKRPAVPKDDSNEEAEEPSRDYGDRDASDDAIAGDSSDGAIANIPTIGGGGVGGGDDW